MFHAGVTCSDCHDPHTLKLRGNGNQVCLQCHLAQKYDSPSHHFHKLGSAGALCVECHMPSRTYMVIDPRRDHSIRVPRPDLSVKLGTPNACNQCHSDKSAQWAVAAINKWYGHAPIGFQQFAQVLQDATEGAPGAPQSLSGLITNSSQPAIARATALSLLAAYAPAPTEAAIHTGISSDSALARRASSHALSNSDPNQSAAILSPLLVDPVRAVRIETADVLASATRSTLPGDIVAALDHSTKEYVAAQELNSDRPEAHLNLGLLYLRENHPDLAEAELKTALSLDPSFGPAAVNLADLYRQSGRDGEGETVLRDALSHTPDDASVLHALGLVMVRLKQGQKALSLLGDAARLDPANARYAYVYAIALDSAGQRGAATATLERALRVHPYDPDSLAALVGFYEQSGKPAEALSYAQRLSEIEPGNQGVQRMILQLNGELHGSGAAPSANGHK
jgi:Tfp pilus assembly protein PilF